jgi:hypothetical protein
MGKSCFVSYEKVLVTHKQRKKEFYAQALFWYSKIWRIQTWTVRSALIGIGTFWIYVKLFLNVPHATAEKQAA